MTHWHDTMVDRPETDGAVYVTGWTISGAQATVQILDWCSILANSTLKHSMARFGAGFPAQRICPKDSTPERHCTRLDSRRLKSNLQRAMSVVGVRRAKAALSSG